MPTLYCKIDVKFRLASFDISAEDFAALINQPTPDPEIYGPVLLRLALKPDIGTCLAAFSFARSDLVAGTISAEVEGQAVVIDCRGVFTASPRPQFVDAVLDPTSEWSLLGVPYEDADGNDRRASVDAALRGLTKKTLSKFNTYRAINETEDVFFVSLQTARKAKDLMFE